MAFCVNYRAVDFCRVRFRRSKLTQAEATTGGCVCRSCNADTGSIVDTFVGTPAAAIPRRDPILPVHRTEFSVIASKNRCCYRGLFARVRLMKAARVSQKPGQIGLFSRRSPYFPVRREFHAVSDSLAADWPPPTAPWVAKSRCNPLTAVDPKRTFLFLAKLCWIGTNAARGARCYAN